MWEVRFDRWNDKWVVEEFTRTDFEEGPNTFHWYSVATKVAQCRNAGRRFGSKTGEEWDCQEEFNDPGDIWPGGSVRYGSSMG